MSTLSDRCFLLIVGSEGGYTDNPSDPGNWTGRRTGIGVCRGTNWGISAAAYPDCDIANLTLEQAQAIFERDYFAKIRGAELSPPLALVVADAAYNSGVIQASYWLQQTVCVAEDGAIGPGTIAAVTAAVASQGASAVCAEYNAKRMFFMTRLSNWGQFGMGWSRRLAKLPYQSLTMEPA